MSKLHSSHLQRKASNCDEVQTSEIQAIIFVSLVVFQEFLRESDSLFEVSSNVFDTVFIVKDTKSNGNKR